MLDKENYCAYARFCDPKGGVWNLIASGNPELEKQGVKEAMLCPAGRLMIVENATGDMLEINEPDTISVLADPIIRKHGPLALRGHFAV